MVKLQQNYNIVFTIGEYNFSHAITKIEIGASYDIGSVYSVFFIHFRIDSKVLFVTEFYKNEEIRLQISFTDIEKRIKEVCDFNLIGISMNFDIGMKAGVKPATLLPDHPLSQNVRLIAISKKPFVSMTTTVNKLFSYKESNIPLDCVEKLATTFLKDLNGKTIDRKNSNNYVIEQLLIPPMTFADGVRFINSKYPLYNGGLPFLFCDVDNNLQIWDITQKIKEREFYKVYYLSKGEKDENAIFKTPGDEMNVFHSSPPQISTNFQSNKQVIRSGYENIIVNKPLDNINEYLNVKIDEVYKDYGLKDNDPENMLTYYKALRYRKSIKQNIPGVDTVLSKTLLNEKIKKSIEIRLSIIGNAPITKFLQIGVPIYFQTNVIEQVKFNGKYIVGTSYIVFTRIDTSNYRFGNLLTCFRGNF